MKNKLVVQILNEVADMLEMQGVEFKPQAYRRAARAVDSFAEPVEELYSQGKLEELPGVGPSIAKKIGEIIETGSLKYHEDLKKKTPVDLDALLSVEGIGPKTVSVLYKKLGIKTLDDLETAAKQHKLSEVKGLGPKTEENILSSLELARRKAERTLLATALPIGEKIRERLEKAVAADGTGGKIELAGSLRRMRETIRDIDVLATARSSASLSDLFTSMPEVRKTLEKGESKSSVLLKDNLQVDLRIIAPESFGSALMYFTGSKDHNIALRKLAIQKGFKLSEYGLFRKTTQVAGSTEKEVYEKLGLDYIPPELREDRGEIPAAMNHKLPELVSYNAIKGDLQMHTNWSDGRNTIEQMAQAAKALDYEYIAISDHYSSMKIVNGLDEERLRGQIKEIDKVNENVDGIRVLKGAEVDIAPDGTPKADKAALKELDIVVASIHGTFKQTKKEMTKRLATAMESGYVHIIGHPTGRKINQKNPSDVDLDELFEVSKRTRTYFEINSSPERLDLSDANVRLAVKAGCKLAINTDAHDIQQLRNMRFGIGVARRGWSERDDIINTQPLDVLTKTIRK